VGIIHVVALLSSCVFSCLSSNRGIRPFPSNYCRHAYQMAGMDVPCFHGSHELALAICVLICHLGWLQFTLAEAYVFLCFWCQPFFDWSWYNCEILFMPMKITVPVWVMDYAHWWSWTCEVLEHCFFYLLLMLLMAVIKPYETSMPKQQLDNSDDLMARLDASHGFMPVMILVFYSLFEVCCCLCFLSSKF
jgi:hypothetical protein